MKILLLSCTGEDIGVAMVTNMVSQLQEIGDLVSKETVCCVGGKVKH